VFSLSSDAETEDPFLSVKLVIAEKIRKSSLLIKIITGGCSKACFHI
jgi:hypothetical protein